ncbi:MAG: hypothetical protein ACE5IZ_06730 [Dehalococcoidia bacterium]
MQENAPETTKEIGNKRALLKPLALLGLVAALLFALAGQEAMAHEVDDDDDDAVDVLGIFHEEEELASFRAMVAPWEGETGATVNYTGLFPPDFSAVLETRVQAGNPPDAAIALGPIDFLQQFERQGLLTPSLSATAWRRP